MRRIVRLAAGFITLAGCLAVGIAQSPDTANSAHFVTRARYVMGTIFEITARAPDPKAAVAAIEDAFGEIRKADELLSHYKPHNALDRMNQTAAKGPVEIAPDLYTLLDRSLRYSEISQGAFDVTAAPLVRLWTEAGKHKRLPSAASIEAARAHCGVALVELLPDSQVRFRRPGTEVQFGAIGKGWAVDRAVDRLRQHGIRDAFVSAGGSTVYALGSGETGPGWRVDIRDPRPDAEGEVAVLCLSNSALSTSGSYENYFEIDGRRYGHIVDPRSGRPVEPLLSATVISPDATESDALSTAVYVMGMDEGERLLDGLGLSGVLIGRPEGNGPLVMRGTGGVRVGECAGSGGVGDGK